MVSRNAWIGITIGVFVLGILIGYSPVFGMQMPQMFVWNPQMMNSMMMRNPQMMNQWNQQIMSSQTGRQQMMTSMTRNPQSMSQMMNDPQFQSQMIQQMSQSHDFMQGMITNMMNDPQIRAQMIGHMLENSEFRQQMQQALGNHTSATITTARTNSTGTTP